MGGVKGYEKDTVQRDLFKEVSPNDPQEFKTLLKIVDSSLMKMHNIIHELTDARKMEHKYKAEEELLKFRTYFGRCPPYH